MLESKFQAGLVKEIKDILPGCYVMKTDTQQLQGFPDLLILYKNKWAVLEAKQSRNSKHQPNQDYYIEELGKDVFASFICPENKEDILGGLQSALRSRRSTRSIKSK